MNQRSIAPGLLLAMPQLEDPNFHRSVVLMIEHNNELSLGLVVNRPSETTVSEILVAMDIPWGGDPGSLVYSGGPVMPRSGWLLHSPVDRVIDEDGTIDVVDGIALSTSPDNLRMLARTPPARVRFLLGYAGWGAGQLELELASGSWLTMEASAELVFETEPEDMWHAALRSLGVDPGSLFPGVGVH